MGFLGSDRGLTPNLDRLARQAVAFSRAYAQVPLTTPSHAAILSGTYPQFNHVNYMGIPWANLSRFYPTSFAEMDTEQLPLSERWRSSRGDWRRVSNAALILTTQDFIGEAHAKIVTTAWSGAGNKW